MADRSDSGSSEKTSVWKKEISFRRKPKEVKPVASAAEYASVWKKEISFKRKPKEGKPVAEPAEQSSVWKKEIHLFGGKAKTEPAAPAEPVAAVPAAPAPVVPAPAAPEPALVPEPPAVAVSDSPLAPEGEPEHSWLTAPLDEISLPPDEPEAEEEAEVVLNGECIRATGSVPVAGLISPSSRLSPILPELTA